jgi:hypothetical protein
MQGFGRDHLLVAPPQQRDLFASLTDQSAKLGSRNLESAWRQPGQCRGFERYERIVAMGRRNARCRGLDRAVAAQVGHLTFGLNHSLHGLFRLAGVALQPPDGLIDRCGGGLQGVLPRDRVLRRALEPVGILHRRIRAQGFETGLRALEPEVRLIVSFLCERFVDLGLFKPRLRFAARPTGIVELGLRLAQRAGLASGLSAGIDAVALDETLNGLCQRLIFLKLTSIFLQLAESFGHVGKQFGWQRR